LQEELAKTNPNLISAASFLSKVCGTDSGYQKLKEATEAITQKGVAEKENVAATDDAAELVGVVADPVIATDQDGLPTTSVATARELIAEPSVVAQGVDDEINQQDDTTDVISLADTVMSVGSSSGDGDRSPSTCGSSVSASGTRKRMAEESPEREPEETSHCEFPGLVTLSAAGCRVNIPPTKDDKEDCPGRILNDDKTFNTKFTICQESASMMSAGKKIAATGNVDADASRLRERTADGREGMVPPVQVMVGPSPFLSLRRPI